MVYRKQKKWLEFFIRMLPVIIFLFSLIINIFNLNQTGTASIDMIKIVNDSINNVNLFFGFFNSETGEIFSNVYMSLFEWLEDYINMSEMSGVLILGFLYYQLLMSIIFLLFDFLNFIVDWARQFIGGFYAKEK